MAAVTTWNLLPSIHAPREGEVALLLDGTRTTILTPMEYIPGMNVWKVRFRSSAEPGYVRARLALWTEV